MRGQKIVQAHFGGALAGRQINDRDDGPPAFEEFLEASQRRRHFLLHRHIGVEGDANLPPMERDAVPAAQRALPPASLSHASSTPERATQSRPRATALSAFLVPSVIHRSTFGSPMAARTVAGHPLPS